MVRAYLRRHVDFARQDPVEAIKAALASVTWLHAAAFFHQAGYLDDERYLWIQVWKRSLGPNWKGVLTEMSLIWHPRSWARV